MGNKLLMSPSPHIHSRDSIEKNMYGVVIALLPALLASVYFFGWNALLLTVVSVLACVLVEYLIASYLLKIPYLTITDGSAVITGVLLALNVPSNLPVWIIIIGAIAAIAIGKMSFGGLGNNVFNPAILGRVFLLISFPAQMTTWPTPQTLNIDAETGATPLAIMKGVLHNASGVSLDNLPSQMDLLWGQIGGSLGEVSAIALLAGLVFMLIRRIITWHIPISILLTMFVFGEIMHQISPDLYASGVVHVLTGGALLGAIFMATDYVTSPMSNGGMILYGVCIGLITMLIRLWGAYPEGMSFAILVMNAFTPLINLYMKPKVFGVTKR